MAALIPWIWFAGMLHLLMAGTSLLLAHPLRYRENLSRVSPIIRQIFIVHSGYITLVLLGFGALCFGFAVDLAGGSPLGKSISGFLSLFWALRIFVQFFYYDSKMKSEHPVLNAGFLAVFIYLTLVFAIATLGGGIP